MNITIKSDSIIVDNKDVKDINGFNRIDLSHTRTCTITVPEKSYHTGFVCGCIASILVNEGVKVEHNN
jgi:hypothetical protein